MHVYVVDYMCSGELQTFANKDQLCAIPKNHVYVICVVSVNIQQIIGDETDGMVLTHRCVETRCFPDVL